MRGRMCILAAALCLTLAAPGCGGDDVGQEVYQKLFTEFWNGCNDRGLYEVKVDAVSPGPDGWNKAALTYTFNNGEVPDTGHALMLVSPDGKSVKGCVYDTDAGICLCGKDNDWNAGK
jgi:hypothetical protein